MKQALVVVVLVVLLILSAEAFAQNIASPAAPMLVKSTYAPFSLYAPDAVTPLFVCVNPAGEAMAKLMAGTKEGVEFDYLYISPKGGPSVCVPIETVFTRYGETDIRISRYDVNSATSSALASEGLPTTFGGQAWEISLSRLLKDQKTALGLALVPRDRSVIDVGGLVSGEAKAQFEGRLGVLRILDKKGQWTAGLVYGYESDKAHADINPFLTGLEDVIRLSGNYSIHTGIAGVSYQPILGTTVSANYTYQAISGPDVDRAIHAPYYAVTQFFTPKLGASIGYEDSGKTACLFYLCKSIQTSIGYTYKSYQSVREYVGDSNTFWLTVSYGR